MATHSSILAWRIPWMEEPDGLQFTGFQRVEHDWVTSLSNFLYILSNCGLMEKTLKSPLDCRDIKPVNPKGNQSWIFTGRTDAKAEAPIPWPPDVKSWLIGKDPDAGKDWRQEEKEKTENEMVGWHHWLDGHEFEQALEVGDGQGVTKSWTWLSNWTE